MFDEGTDVSVSQSLIIYVRYLVVNQASSRIEPVTSFLAIRSLFRANAESITREILDVLNEKKIPLDRLTGLATDGAAVMSGKKYGIVQLLKQIQPDMVSTHGIAHRLVLSCGGAADKIPYIVKFQGLLNDIFKYFRNSGKNSASLIAIQSIVEQANNCKKFKEVFHTRWLSFDGYFPSLATELRFACVFVPRGIIRDSPRSLQANNLVQVPLRSTIFGRCDGAPVKTQQDVPKELHFTDVNPLLEATVDTIKELKESKSRATMKKILSAAPTTPAVDDDWLTAFEFGPHTIRDGQQQRKEAVSACDSFTDLVIQNLQDRFSATEDATTLTSLTRLLSCHQS